MGGISNIEVMGDGTFDSGIVGNQSFILEFPENFSGNIYNKKLSVDFVKFIRGEKKFNGIDQLRNQIKKDILVAKNN